MKGITILMLALFAIAIAEASRSDDFVIIDADGGGVLTSSGDYYPADVEVNDDGSVSVWVYDNDEESED